MLDDKQEALKFQSLYLISNALNQAEELAQGYKQVFSILSKNLGLKRGTLALLNSQGELELMAARGLKDPEDKTSFKIGEGIMGQVASKGQPVVVPRIKDEPMFLDKTGRRSELPERDDISFICVPVMAAGKVLGTLSADRLFGDEVGLSEDVKLLTMIASFIAQTVLHRTLRDEERSNLREENQKLRQQLTEKYNIHNIVGKSNKMHDMYRMISQVAKTQATVLIRGESGTGKELVAHAIHYNSNLKTAPFIKVNMAALPDSLIESELFGHEAGSFTGAQAQRKGRFEMANGGTIFLDEIGDLSLATQVKLLRVLQEGEFERIGSGETIKIKVRVLAATNKDLEKMIAEGKFREDLYYRLNVVPIFLPPLRERKTDILLLAEHFLERYAKEHSKTIHRVNTPAINMLMQYHWPGNVRELQNCIERAVIMCDGDVIMANHLPPTLQMPNEKRSEAGPAALDAVMDLPEVVRRVEMDRISDALKQNNRVVRRAAKQLGLTERMLAYKIQKYNILV